jgi:hypothetical protein
VPLFITEIAYPIFSGLEVIWGFSVFQRGGQLLEALQSEHIVTS